MDAKPRRASAGDMPLQQLEQALIDEFVRMRGHDADALATMSEAERHELLTAASVYASSRLAEVEARAHFAGEIHGDSEIAGKTE
jgi:hypothetical protein